MKKRILYFDIDGVLLTYEETPKEALQHGVLQDLLKKLRFETLVCVSGWSDLYKMLNPVRELHQRDGVYELIRAIFPDKQWFFDRLVLADDTDVYTGSAWLRWKKCLCISRFLVRNFYFVLFTEFF